MLGQRGGLYTWRPHHGNVTDLLSRWRVRAWRSRPEPSCRPEPREDARPEHVDEGLLLTVDVVQVDLAHPQGEVLLQPGKVSLRVSRNADGGVQVGGGAPVVVQSMTLTKTLPVRSWASWRSPTEAMKKRNSAGAYAV